MTSFNFDINRTALAVQQHYALIEGDDSVVVWDNGDVTGPEGPLVSGECRVLASFTRSEAESLPLPSIIDRIVAGLRAAQRVG